MPCGFISRIRSISLCLQLSTISLFINFVDNVFVSGYGCTRVYVLFILIYATPLGFSLLWLGIRLLVTFEARTLNERGVLDLLPVSCFVGLNRRNFLKGLVVVPFGDLVKTGEAAGVLLLNRAV